MNSAAPLIYDHGKAGNRIPSLSATILLVFGALIILLAATSPLVSPFTVKNVFYAILLLGFGAWMGLMGLHFRRDRHAFTTRYVLGDEGVEILSSGAASEFVSWSQFQHARQSRLLRYFSLVHSAHAKDVVLVFGAPPKEAIGADLKYQLTGKAVSAKLGERFVKGWI
jgi:hypothetical protein